MVMFQGTPHQVAATVAPGVHLTDKAELGKDVKGAIDGNQTDARALLTDFIMYLSRGEVVAVEGYGVEYRAPLRGQLVPLAPENARYLLLCERHDN
jgi:hypothetical protein